MVIDSGSRRRGVCQLRIVSALLTALMVWTLLDSGPAAAWSTSDLTVQAQASPDQQPLAPSATDRPVAGTRPSANVAPGQVGARAKSGFEKTHNPFGDDWSLKTTSNPSIPVGLTPVCPRPPDKPNADENRFIALTNSPLLFTECVDLPDATLPDGQGGFGNPLLKLSIAQIKALNPAVKYIGYRQAPRADVATAGQADIDANHEDWFVHIAGQPATRANRVKYSNGIQDLYDVTNPAFRQFIVNAYVASLNLHGLDGFVLSDCLDQPFNSPATPVPAAISLNWEAGCDALLAATKAALDPLGKLVFTFGFDHVATRGTSANDAAAFAMFAKRMEFTHGLFWEDPFRGITAPVFSAEASIERYKQLRDYATARGRYILHTDNTFEGAQSTFATTNAAEQKALARYYLASFLAVESGPLTVAFHYYPTSVGPQFASNAYFKEWDLRVGNPRGADTKPAEGVYQREFQNGRVVANLSSAPFTVDLADSTYTDADGVPLGTSAVVPAKSGGFFMRAIREVTCTPRPAVRVTTALNGAGQVKVTVAAGGTGAGGNTLQTIRFNAVDNGVLDAGSQTGSAGNVTLTLPFDAEQTSFVIRRSAGGRATTVRFVVTDGCGDWPSFAGLGPNVP
jgi:hypothetical protein